MKTSIQLDESTKALLIEQGRFQESYDMLLRRLLKELERLRDGAKAD